MARPEEEGVYQYTAGVSGTASVPSGASRILSIAARASSGGSITIDGGDPIPIPAGANFADDFRGRLRGPATLIFDGTDAYFVDWLI